MESFLYIELNKVCREKDEKKIKYFGQIAAALGYIIEKANQRRKDGHKGN